MGNWAAEVMAPIMAHYREAALQDAWGHLAPDKNVSYPGRILFTKSQFNSGSITVIDYEIKNLESSPWLWDFVDDQLDKWRKDLEYGSVYEWTTTFRNYRFYGKPRQVIKFKPLN